MARKSLYTRKIHLHDAHDRGTYHRSFNAQWKHDLGPQRHTITIAWCHLRTDAKLPFLPRICRAFRRAADEYQLAQQSTCPFFGLMR